MKGSNTSSTIVPFEKGLKIAGLQKNSAVDFPGCLSAVVFFAGCNYRCYYCHNRHIIDSPPLLDTGAVLEFLEKRAGLLDGVTLSGGEATLQGGLYSFARGLKAMGYRVKVDSNGSRPDTLRALLADGLADFVAVDYKAPLHMYDGICGSGAMGGAGVRESLYMLEGSGVEYEARVTVIPQITERKLAEMAESLPRLRRFVLQLYRPVNEEGELRAVDAGAGGAAAGRPYTPAELRALALAIRYAQPNVTVRA
ncbi:MAG: anaerobic ribonucleoside-triphosphate reductase activating protein [Clostridiales Family XIII bacterium]|jgi:pyruvate formate lyase activating enzyme|nr:anaerobic ribonucleoside-triphosphate reductase activating protein [Clostridiales Family XIII bacterium]